MKREAEKIAYNYLVRKSAFRLTKLPNLDMRTKVGKLALQMIYKMEKDFDFETVKEKRIKRNSNRRDVFENILNNPLVKDYFSNKFALKKVHDNRLEFYGRNHWAKNEKDLRILKILRNEKN